MHWGNFFLFYFFCQTHRHHIHLSIDQSWRVEWSRPSPSICTWSSPSSMMNLEVTFNRHASYSEWGNGACFVSLVHACFFLTLHDSSFTKPELQLWAWLLCTFWLQQWPNNPLGIFIIQAPKLKWNPESLFTWLVKSGFFLLQENNFKVCLHSICLPCLSVKPFFRDSKPSAIQNPFLGNDASHL